MFFATTGRPVRAAAPSIDYLFPAGGRQGSTVTITAGGKADAEIDPWPAKVWADCPGLEFTPGETAGIFTVKIAEDASAGPHLVRVYNADGASAPRVFVVSRTAEVEEHEPNDGPAAAQMIDALPATVNGRLEKGNDADCYAVQMEEGRWLVAELACRRLGSPVDPMLRVLGPDGVEVAFNHDTFGLDPLVAFRAPRAGRYVIEVAGFTYPPGTDVRFTGSKSAVYRLLLTTGPYARYAFPAGLRRSPNDRDSSVLHLFGWNFAPNDPAATWQPDAFSFPPGAAETLVSPPAVANTLRIALGGSADREETEPAGLATPDSPDKPRQIDLPVVLNGRIAKPGDVRRFAFTAEKGRPYRFAVTSAALDLPLDAVLTLADSTGKQLATADDEGSSPDPKLDWTAPADGQYVLALSDRTRAGGDEYVYRLEMAPLAPDFRATVGTTAATDSSSTSPPTGAFKLEASKSVDVPVTISRQGGHAAPLAVVVTGLPEGVTAATPGASTKAGPLALTLTASATAAASNQPIRVLVVSADDRHPAARPATLDLGADQMIRRTDALWLTVTRPPPATRPATAPAADGAK